ncbi:12385_t:CDS:2 [Funneliformis geosporum]|uniref:12385_t:CDS:1 n=1 Tax=Funneliformis geosporum TaxID=1117311 RepID=A0A9W4WU67_9GLOM|nr:12385_t:CDS:2 [Funneliformis geosporum]
MCQSLCDSEHINYIVNSPACFSGIKKPEIVAKQLFSKKFPEDKEVLTIYHMYCKRKTDNRNTICNKCKELKCNKCLNKVLKVECATSSIVKFTPCH